MHTFVRTLIFFYFVVALLYNICFVCNAVIMELKIGIFHTQHDAFYALHTTYSKLTTM